MQARRTTFLPLLLLISSVFICFSPPAQAQDTVQVKAGWNLIGSVKAGAAPDVLSTDPAGIITTQVYGYNPGVGYEKSDTLTKGLGYWVKVSADGAIILEVTPPDTVVVADTAACGLKTVAYAGMTYRTVQIGSQCWLDQNLNVGTMVTGATEQTDNATTEKYCYNDDPANCGVYGGLYQWNEAMQYTTTPGTQGICPPGWHIPTFAEFTALKSTVGDNGNALKQGGVGTGGGIGTNTSGFSALLAGYRYDDGYFASLGNYAYFWSSTEYDATLASTLYLLNYNSYIFLNYDYKNYGFSVRCLED